MEYTLSHHNLKDMIERDTGSVPDLISLRLFLFSWYFIKAKKKASHECEAFLRIQAPYWDCSLLGMVATEVDLSPMPSQSGYDLTVAS